MGRPRRSPLFPYPPLFRSPVEDGARGRYQKEGPARDRRWLLNPVDGLDRYAADRDQKKTGIDESRQYGGSPIAVGMLLRRPFARKPRGTPRQQQRDHVGEIMNGVGYQRQRVRGVAENELRGDERRIECNAHGKRKPDTVRCVAVPGMTVGVRMVVTIVLMGHGAYANRCGVVWIRPPRS